MKDILISDSELDELILILQMSAYDADVASGQSHDVEEVAALREHKSTVVKWLTHFQQLRQERKTK